MLNVKTVVAAAAFSVAAAFATSSGASAGALTVPQLDRAEMGQQAPVIEVNHRRKHYKKRRHNRISNYCYNNPWDCRQRRRHYARRSCYYDYYGDLVCSRRRAHFYPYFGFGFGF